MTVQSGELFFAQDFEGFLPEDAVAGDPAGDDGEHGRAG
jgi:hypothetical protein